MKYLLREIIWWMASNYIKTRANFVKVLRGDIDKVKDEKIGAAYWFLSTTLTK